MAIWGSAHSAKESAAMSSAPSPTMTCVLRVVRPSLADSVCLLACSLFALSLFTTNSQVVQLLIQRRDLHAVLLDLSLLGGYISSDFFVASMAFLCDTYGHVEVRDLVGILAGCRDFDRTGPVEIEVAERVG